MAVGAAIWGSVADAIGLVPTLLVAAVVLAAASLAGLVLAVPDTPLDRSVSMHWAAPTMVLDVPETGGPVLVTIEYRVPPHNADLFIESMREMGRSRLRTGALHWDLYRDGKDPDTYLEVFQVASWEEHLRQHGGRLTGSDRETEERARSLVDPDHPFRVTHYLPARRSGPG